MNFSNRLRCGNAKILITAVALIAGEQTRDTQKVNKEAIDVIVKLVSIEVEGKSEKQFGLLQINERATGQQVCKLPLWVKLRTVITRPSPNNSFLLLQGTKKPSFPVPVAQCTRSARQPLHDLAGLRTFVN